MNKFIRNRDQLGVPIRMTYNDRDTFETTIGGLCSVCGSFIVIAFAFTQIYTLLFNPSFAIKTTSLFDYNANFYEP